MFFMLFFLLLLDNGRSKDHIQVGNNFSEEVELCEDRQEDEEVYNNREVHGQELGQEDEEVYISGGEQGGDGQGDLEEEDGSGSLEVNSI